MMEIDKVRWELRDVVQSPLCLCVAAVSVVPMCVAIGVVLMCGCRRCPRYGCEVGWRLEGRGRDEKGMGWRAFWPKNNQSQD